MGLFKKLAIRFGYTTCESCGKLTDYNYDKCEYCGRNIK